MRGLSLQRGAPYGGKKSPLMEYRNWREWLLALAVHEFNHVNQYQNNLRRSEVACERKAADALDRFRVMESQHILGLEQVAAD
jgi:hypothetical protein